MPLSFTTSSTTTTTDRNPKWSAILAPIHKAAATDFTLISLLPSPRNWTHLEQHGTIPAFHFHSVGKLLAICLSLLDYCLETAGCGA